MTRLLAFASLAISVLGGHALAAVQARWELGDLQNGLNNYEAREPEWPYGPFHTKGRDIVNARGEKIKWAGLNWPMSGM
jgi:hypothetical protein